MPRRVVVGTKAPTPPVGGGSGSLGRGRESSNKSSQTGVAGDKKQGVCMCVCVCVHTYVCLYVCVLYWWVVTVHITRNVKKSDEYHRNSDSVKLPCS